MIQNPANYPYFLYGEDHKMDQALLVELMRQVDAAITVVCRSNGLEIIQYLDSLQLGASYPGCILLDIQMPMWDGFRTLTALKEHPKYHHLPCIVLSNSTSVRDRDLAKRMGAEDFLSKFTEPEEWRVHAEMVAGLCHRPPMIKS